MKTVAIILALLLAGCGYDANVSPAMFYFAEDLCVNNDGLQMIYVDNSHADLHNRMVYPYKVVCVNSATFYGYFKEKNNE